MQEGIESIIAAAGEMALFTAASKHFVKTAGNTSLHSIPDLNSAERFKVLCLVYRKTSFWPWKKAKVKPTLVTLNDILDVAIDAKPFISNQVIAESYKDTPSFKADGNIGAKIASELDLDLTTTDKFSLNVNFGDISKTEVNWESLEKALANSIVNVNHEIFKEMRQTKRTSLCVVLESLACKKDGTLDEESDLKGTGKVSATVPKVTTVSVDVHMQGDLEKTSHFSYTIPSNTVIAFSCTKMDVNEEGKVAMHVGVDKVDNIDANLAPELDRSAEIRNELEPFLSSKIYQDIKKALLDILETPSCLENLLEMTSTAHCLVEENISFALPAKKVSDQFPGVKSWRKFLELVGFLIPETIESGKVEFPRSDPNKVLHGSWALLEALSELSEKDTYLLLKCKPEYKEKLLNALSNTMAGKDTPYSEVGKILEADSNEKEFLTNLGFVILEGTNGKCLKAKWHSHHKIIDAYIAVFALL